MILFDTLTLIFAHHLVLLLIHVANEGDGNYINAGHNCVHHN